MKRGLSTLTIISLIVLILLIILGNIFIFKFTNFEYSKETRECIKSFDPFYKGENIYSSDRYMNVTRCLIYSAIEQNNPDICSNNKFFSQDLSMVSNCKGRVTKNVSYCKDKYPINPTKTDLVFHCISGVVRSTGDTNICFSDDYIDLARKRCSSDKTLLQVDPSCSWIINTSIRSCVIAKDEGYYESD